MSSRVVTEYRRGLANLTVRVTGERIDAEGETILTGEIITPDHMAGQAWSGYESALVSTLSLREWRDENDVTQAALAETLGVMQHHIARWESGERTPGLDTAVRIEDATGGQVPARSWLEQNGSDD